MKGVAWTIAVILMGLTIFLVRKYRCNQCKMWFSLRLRHDWHNGGGLGPAGWTQNEWCRHCHHHTSRVVLENGEVFEDQARIDPHPWWVNKLR